VRRARNATPETLAGLGAAVLDALPISLYVVDRNLRVVAWNQMRERGPIGRPRQEALGRHLSKSLPPRGFRATLPVIRSVLRSGVSHEETTETRDGSRLFHVRRLPVRRAGRVSHVISWFDDITERRALEMRLIASDRLAFLGQLVAGVAHEVSNPLAGIAGCAEALASLALGPRNRKARREALEFRDLIRGEVARCERIVRSLLDTARSTAGSSAELAAIVGTTLRLLERHPAFARVKVVSRIPPGLPAARIDPDSLKQVVMALAINAAKAMPAGGTLTLKAGAAERRVLLDVLDSGPGVPSALRSRIFEPFFTTDTATGSGLGLPIARTLVRRHGGDLVYRTRARPGACFRVLLPAIPRRQ
jgi:two-component system NtrC family sensor kinase